MFCIYKRTNVRYNDYIVILEKCGTNGDESMDERGRNVERTCEKISESQELIIEMVSKIKNQKYIKMIYGFTKRLYDEERAEG